MTDTSKAKPAELLTTAELAQKYRVSHRTILNWESAGLISPTVREGRVLRWDASEVATALERKVGTNSRAC